MKLEELQQQVKVMLTAGIKRALPELPDDLADEYGELAAIVICDPENRDLVREERSRQLFQTIIPSQRRLETLNETWANYEAAMQYAMNILFPDDHPKTAMH